MHLALFGAGRAGSIHIENILAHRHLKLKYLVEADLSKAEQLLRNTHVFGEVKIVHINNASEVYNDAELNAVCVCTPTETHHGIVCQALENGKHVFCEKPIADNLNETAKCYELAEAKQLILFCSFNRRFDPTIRAVYKQIHNENAIGRIHVVKTCARDNPKPSLDYLKISGGIYHDCAVHDLDLACWLMREFPSQVYVRGHAWDPEIAAIGDHDTCVIHLTFPSGGMAVIDLSRSAVYGYDQRLEVLGDTGMIQSENQREASILHFKVQGTQLQPLKYSFQQRYKESYIAALHHFIDLIEGKASNEITKESVTAISSLADACDKSAKTGKIVDFQAPVF